ncbi:MAG TPA: LysE family translocator [Pseudolabrys sp.]|jgi:threonine/homoserine/homoserine lactone efflux protein|nr:LysE family translocator [Pseudolabrys sp.]
MQVDVFLALVVFAFVMAFTPGPNNILLAHSGVNFGFARTIPHQLGVDVGFVFLLAVFAAGLGVVFAAAPALQLALKIAGALYMLWLAWKVASARPLEEKGAAAGRPMTFLQAAAFQWINPKAVVAALSGIAVYMRPGHEFGDFLIVLAVFAVSTVLSTATWTGFGVALRGLLHNPTYARIFNVTMGVLLAACIIPIVSE